MYDRDHEYRPSTFKKWQRRGKVVAAVLGIVTGVIGGFTAGDTFGDLDETGDCVEVDD